MAGYSISDGTQFEGSPFPKSNTRVIHMRSLGGASQAACARATTAEAAATAATSSAATAAAQPAKTKAFKMPSKELFPAWTSGKREMMYT
jgi:hypothetical protein